MDTFHCVLQGLSRTQHACSCCHSTCQRVVVVVAPWGQRAIQMVTAHMAPTWIPMCCVCLWPRDSSARHSPALTAVPPLFLSFSFSISTSPSIAQLCSVLFASCSCLGAAGTCRVCVAIVRGSRRRLRVASCQISFSLFRCS